MSSDDDIIKRMRQRAVGWRYAELARLLRRAGFEVASSRGSHRKWSHPGGVRLVLVDRPGSVRPEYVRTVLHALAQARGEP